MRVFLIRVSPQRTSPVRMHSNCFPEKSGQVWCSKFIYALCCICRFLFILNVSLYTCICILTATSIPRSTCPEMGLTLLGGGDRSSYKHSNLLGSELYCRDFFLSKPWQHGSIAGIPPLGSECKPNSIAGISPSRRLNSVARLSPLKGKSCRYRCGTNPTRELHSKPFHMSRSQSNSPKQTSNNEKIAKQIRQDPNNTSISKILLLF